MNSKIEKMYLNKIKDISGKYNPVRGLIEEYMEDFGLGYQNNR